MPWLRAKGLTALILCLSTITLLYMIEVFHEKAILTELNWPVKIVIQFILLIIPHNMAHNMKISPM